LYYPEELLHNKYKVEPYLVVEALGVECRDCKAFWLASSAHDDDDEMAKALGLISDQTSRTGEPRTSIPPRELAVLKCKI
jgi:hypothetical protein